MDGIFITVTQPSKEVKEVIKKHNANYSFFEWENDFAKARNYNFAQVPQEYTHIIWLDADDVIAGGENLKKTITDKDVYFMNYLYHFDENGLPDVVHIKARIYKNDNCVKWQGKIHEDTTPLRELKSHFIESVAVEHKTDDDRIEESKVRNLMFAKEQSKETPDDPRVYWNLGNSFKALGENTEAIKSFNKFVEVSESDEERFIAYCRMAEIYLHEKNFVSALVSANQAIGLQPRYPDGYNVKGYIYFEQGRFTEAVEIFRLALGTRPPQTTVMAYNPRDYDFYPLLTLAKCYINLSLFTLALPLLNACKEIMPRPDVVKMHKIVNEEAQKEKKVIKYIEKLKKIKDNDELKKEIDKIDADYRSHPMLCQLVNDRLVKTTSSGKDLVIYCYHTDQIWTPETIKTEKVGGSEEAVINLAQQLHKRGWNVTVYNNCGHKEQVFDGVTYKPVWSWNYKDKQDVVWLWRTPTFVDYDINADKIIIDVHDVVPSAEFTEERLKKIYRVFLKTQAHRQLYPNIPDEKISIVPNGMDFDLFKQDVEKDQYLMVNTSSPDRSLDVLPKLFAEVKKQVPQAKCKWCYGWDVYDLEPSEKKQQWKRDTVKAMKDAGIEDLGSVTQKEACKLYLQANILAYPSEFLEIDCITVKKAQACGSIPVTTDFGALDESVKTGVKIHSKKTLTKWYEPQQFTFGLEDEKAQQEWVGAVVKILKEPIGDRTEMIKKMDRYNWENIADDWNNILCK